MRCRSLRSFWNSDWEKTAYKGKMRLVSRFLAATSACFLASLVLAYDTVFTHDVSNATNPVVAVDDATGTSMPRNR